MRGFVDNSLRIPITALQLGPHEQGEGRKKVARKNKQVGWAIVGEIGLYVGWQQTRADAIAEHVFHSQRTDEPKVSPWAAGHNGRGRGLSYDQDRMWQRRRKAGDRAVKVTISWHEQ